MDFDFLRKPSKVPVRDLFPATKRRTFLSSLLTIPLALIARFGPSKVCGMSVFETQRARVLAEPFGDVRCNLPRGHKGPHVWLNPR
jgi:hypothetical protein